MQEYECNAVKTESEKNGCLFTDSRDGQTYRTVKIGDQVWLAENFRYKCPGAFAYNNDEKKVELYGRLYTWDAAMNCVPEGWHLPTKKEFKRLISFVEKRSKVEVGTALKSKTGWEKCEGISAGTDEFGFCALPAGGRFNDEEDFAELGRSAEFWSATSEPRDLVNVLFDYIVNLWKKIWGNSQNLRCGRACRLDLDCEDEKITLWEDPKNWVLSVRLVRDA